jgi:hypothetical protein
LDMNNTNSTKVYLQGLACNTSNYRQLITIVVWIIVFTTFTFLVDFSSSNVRCYCWLPRVPEGRSIPLDIK